MAAVRSTGERQSVQPSLSERVIVIGAGPGGLTAAHELTELGHEAIVFEKDDQVGGIARTVSYRGYRFDIGGHRFFTKVDTVQTLWEEVMGDDFLVRPRLSRIYYRQLSEGTRDSQQRRANV
jgi:protoporphyrinogen oxidase